MAAPFTVTRKTYWTVNGVQHATISEAYQDAANQALASPGTVVEVVGASYEVVYTIPSVVPPTPPPPITPPAPPTPPNPQVGTKPKAEVLAMGMAVGYIAYNEDTSSTVPSVKWDFGDGTTSTEGKGQHLYDKAGVYDVTETVTFMDGSTGQATNRVNISLVPKIVPDGLSILYHLDTNDFVEATNWSFGDGTIGEDGLPDGRHPYSKAGTYTITGSVIYHNLPDRMDQFGPIQVTVYAPGTVG